MSDLFWAPERNDLWNVVDTGGASVAASCSLPVTSSLAGGPDLLNDRGGLHYPAVSVCPGAGQPRGWLAVLNPWLTGGLVPVFLPHCIAHYSPKPNTGIGTSLPPALYCIL